MSVASRSQHLGRPVARLFALLIAASSSTATAANITECASTTVMAVDVGGTGNVLATFQNATTYIKHGELCSLVTDVGTGATLIKKEACAAMLSLLLAAQLSSRPVTLYFMRPGLNDSTASCTIPGEWPTLHGDPYFFYHLSMSRIQ